MELNRKNYFISLDSNLLLFGSGEHDVRVLALNDNRKVILFGYNMVD